MPAASWRSPGRGRKSRQKVILLVTKEEAPQPKTSAIHKNQRQKEKRIRVAKFALLQTGVKRWSMKEARETLLLSRLKPRGFSGDRRKRD